MPIRAVHRLLLLLLIAVAALPAAELPAHPRLLATAGRFAALAAGLDQDPMRARLWRKVQDRAERCLAGGPPPWHDDGDLSQEWQRATADHLPVLALAWRLGGDRRHLEGLQAWIRAALAYPTWGSRNHDLAAGHMLSGLAIAYDWCHADLPEALRADLRRTMVERAPGILGVLAKGHSWARADLQNHQWIALGGLLAAALAIADEEPAAQAWIAPAAETFDRVRDRLPLDGSSNEGPGYWSYGASRLLQTAELGRSLLGRDWYATPWWRGSVRYAAAMTLPRQAWQGKAQAPIMVDIEDGGRGFFEGPAHILWRLAAECRDGTAQELAAALEAGGGTYGIYDWMALLWYDPAAAGAAEPLPTLLDFPDKGLVSARTGWSGDESLLVATSGPPTGHRARAAGWELGGSAGHVHPNAGAFCLFGAGRWLVRNAGYMQSKDIRYENTLSIDGIGQLGDGGPWLDGAASRANGATLRVVASTPELDHLVADATGAFDRTRTGLRRFQRHLVLLKRHAVLLVLDDIALERPADLRLALHPAVEPRLVGDGIWDASDASATLTVRTWGPAAETSTWPVRGRHHDGRDVAIPTLTLRRPAAQSWRQGTALAWAPSGAAPAVVQAEAPPSTGSWRVQVGQDPVLEIDPDAGAVAGSP